MEWRFGDFYLVQDIDERRNRLGEMFREVWVEVEDVEDEFAGFGEGHVIHIEWFRQFVSTMV